MDKNVGQDRWLREQQTRVDALTACSGTQTAAIAAARLARHHPATPPSATRCTPRAAVSDAGS